MHDTLQDVLAAISITAFGCAAVFWLAVLS